MDLAWPHDLWGSFANALRVVLVDHTQKKYNIPLSCTSLLFGSDETSHCSLKRCVALAIMYVLYGSMMHFFIIIFLNFLTN